MKIIIILTYSLSLIFISSCTSPIIATSSLTPLNKKIVIENLGKTKGTDSAVSVLSLYMIGRPDIDVAIEEAKKARGADTLINVRCYETFSWFILFSISTVTVEGDAVKLADEEIKETRIVPKGRTR